MKSIYILLLMFPFGLLAQNNNNLYDWDSAHFDFANPQTGNYLSSNNYLKNIFETDCYGFNKYKNEKRLDSLAKIINFYLNCIFAIEVHTDCRATAEYNHDLTQRAADSTRAYLLQRIKDTAQLPVAVGMGEDSLLIKKCQCNLIDAQHICTEAEHSQNRRLVLRVIGKINLHPWIDSTDLLNGITIGDRIHIWTLFIDLSANPKPSVYYDSVANLINNNQNWVFQLENHADCRYSNAYSINYSQRRADSTRAWLLPLLADTNQLPIAIGKGDDELYNPKCKCDISDYLHICTEREHQQNRRTVLRIIGRKED
jgi:outer membrane protein OmpA-like peptidoglycan-associated protein